MKYLSIIVFLLFLSCHQKQEETQAQKTERNNDFISVTIAYYPAWTPSTPPNNIKYLLKIKNDSYRYYVRDYLGSTRAVLAEDGTLLQDANYYPGGLSFSQLSDTEETDRLHCGKEWVDMEGLGWYDNTARFHDAILCRYTTPDPLAEQYSDTMKTTRHKYNNILTF